MATSNDGMGQLFGAWDALTMQQKQQAALVALVALWIGKNYLMTLVLIAAVVTYLSARKPKPESFGPFFEVWWKTQYYPRIAEKVKSELRERANRKADEGKILASLGDQARSWLFDSTKGIQSEVLYQAVSKRYLFVDRGPILSVTVNLGSQEDPANATFWGIHENWILAPYQSIDFDNVSLLESIQQQQ